MATAAARRAPQDRKPKATTEPTEFTFEHDGKTFTLPPAQTLGHLIPGRTMRDAVMDGEEGQLRLSFFMLELLEDSKEAIDALYEKPAADMLVLVEAWMKFKPKDGVTLGE